MRYNPYRELKKSAIDWVRRALTRKSVKMWFYPKDKLGLQWRIDDLYHRVAAAEQLGYDVILTCKEGGNEAGLHVTYKEKLPATPWFY